MEFPSKRKPAQHAYYLKNRRKFLDKAKEWSAKHPGYWDTPGHFWNTLRHRALRKKKEFTLTKAQFMWLWKQPCTYCGAAISNAGIDRVDNAKGYVYGNVVSCCRSCNSAKLEDSVSDFVARCKRVVELHG